MPKAACSRPRSPAQREASQRNGARSRGPVSPAGKARASRNALRNGLTAAVHLVTLDEDPAALEALRAELVAEFEPASASEALLVERLALAFWKLARSDRLEARLARIEPRCPEGRLYPEPELPRLLSRLPELSTLLRHQAELGRDVHRLLRALADRPAAGEAPAEDAAEQNLRNEPEPVDALYPPKRAAWMAGSAAGRYEVETHGRGPSVTTGPRPDHPAASSSVVTDQRSGRPASPSPVTVGPRTDHPDPPSVVAGQRPGHPVRSTDPAGPAQGKARNEPEPHPWTAGSAAGRDDRERTAGRGRVHCRHGRPTSRPSSPFARPGRAGAAD